MGLIKYGGGVVDISGSIGGTVFSRNRFGAYARPRTVPVDPGSARQVAARTRIAFLAEQWRETPVTEAMRIAWGVYAAGISAVNRLGEDITLTGFNAFIMGNSVKLLNGSDFVEDGPTEIGLPAQDPAFQPTLSAANGITVVFDDTFEWCDEDDAYLSIELGQPQSPSRNFFGGPYRFHAGVAGDSVAAPTTPDGPTAVTCWTLIQGQKVWCRARILREDGRVSHAFECTPIIVGA